MSEQKNMTQSMVAFRLPAHLVARLEELAKQTDRSKSAVLRELIRRAYSDQADIALKAGH